VIAVRSPVPVPAVIPIPLSEKLVELWMVVDEAVAPEKVKDSLPEMGVAEAMPVERMRADNANAGKWRIY